MNDFRISVFIAVAQSLSFTKAALVMHISQPAISKHINELESLYSIQLFERGKSGVTLTAAGERFLELALEIDQKYREMRFEMDMKGTSHSGELRIGASTTIAHYLLPSIISKFISRFPNIKLSLVTGNTEHIERVLTQNKIDLGVAEGLIHRKEFKYTHLSKDELVVITSTKNSTNRLTIAELKKIPLVMRENGSGTLEVVTTLLKDRGILFTDLNIIIQLGSSEAIKRFVMEGKSYAILSIAAVREEVKNGKLKVIKVESDNFERNFSFLTHQGNHNRLADKFITFAKSYLHTL